jgi:hypothetical protein
MAEPGRSPRGIEPGTISLGIGPIMPGRAAYQPAPQTCSSRDSHLASAANGPTIFRRSGLLTALSLVFPVLLVAAVPRGLRPDGYMPVPGGNSAGRNGKHSSHHCTDHLRNSGPLDRLMSCHAGHLLPNKGELEKPTRGSHHRRLRACRPEFSITLLAVSISREGWTTPDANSGECPSVRPVPHSSATFTCRRSRTGCADH